MPQFNLASRLAAAALLLAAMPAAAVRTEQAGVIADGIEAAAPAPLGASWARYRASGALRLLDWQADGRLLVAVPAPHGMQAARIAGPLAAPELLAPADGAGAADGVAATGNVTAAAAHPFDARRVALRFDAGQGRARLAVLDPGAPALALLEAPARADAPLWAHDGRRLAYARTREDGTSDVLIAEPAAGLGEDSAPGAVAAAPVTIAPIAIGPAAIGDAGRWHVLDWSRDDRRLLLRRELDADDARLYVADVASGALTPLDAPDGRRPVRMRLPAARFTPAGDAVLYLRDDGEDGRVRLKLAPLDGAAPRALSTPMPHDVEYFDVSADGRFLAYSWSDAGYGHLAVLDQRAHALVALPADLPAGAIGRLRFDRGGTRLALEASTATTPPEIDVIDLATGALARWAQAAAAGGTLAPAQRFRFRTWDRSGGRARELAAYLYAPAGPGPHPVLVLLHDGPRGEFGAGYDAWRQFVVGELGIAVVAPNPRGPGGTSGRTAAAQGDGTLREDMTRDLGSLLVWIGAQPALDATRVAVMGSGGGGAQALVALAAYGDRLRGAVAIDPPADAQSLGSAGALLRPALIAHLDDDAAGRISDAEQLLWRLRSSRREAAYLALDAARCADTCRATAEAGVRASIGAYLQALLAPGAGAAPVSATRAP